MTNRQRIKKTILEVRDRLVEDGKINKTQFAKTLGTTASVIASKDRQLTVDMIIMFFEKYSNFLSPNELFEFEELSPEFEDNISFITNANAGSSISISFKEKDINYSFKIPDLDRKHYAFRVKGNSMYPTLENGDILICMKIDNRDIISGEVYVVNTNDGINVKRVVTTSTNGKLSSIELISDNSEHNPPIKPDLSSHGLHGSSFFQAYRPVRRIIKNPQLKLVNNSIE